MNRHRLAFIGGLIVLLAALAPIAVRIRERHTIAKMACVATASSGEIHVHDFDNPWGSKALGHLDLVWTATSARPDWVTPEEARDVAARVVDVLRTDERAFSGQPLSTIGSAAISVTCDGAAYSAELAPQHAPDHLWDCGEDEQPARCARGWLHDLVHGARRSVTAMLDLAYISQDVIDTPVNLR